MLRVRNKDGSGINIALNAGERMATVEVVFDAKIQASIDVEVDDLQVAVGRLNLEA